MSSSLVIVGIPKEDDRVWKVSSEKVPHLTLLHLGDVEQVQNLEQIMLFVEHAASTTLRPFYLPVERRGELGDAKADVLFFRKGRYDFRAVRDFRTMLLKDSNIKTAYDATSQFELPAEVGAPGQPWIPHLTLGYPESPAKPIPDDYAQTFYDVCFDKVAVWIGDYEGPEFLLKDYWEEADEMLDTIPMDVAMSDIHHHGVKGMRWGVRKEAVAGPRGSHIRISNRTNVAAVSNASQVGLVGAATFVPGIGAFAAFLHPRFRAEYKAAGAHNKLVRQDKKWKKRIDKSKKGVEVHNTAADEINSKLPGFNKDKRWMDSKGNRMDLSKDPVKLKEYNDAITKEVLNPAYAKAAVKVYGSTSPSQRYTFEVHDAATGTLKVTDALAERRKAQLAGVQHAATDDEDPPETIEVSFKISRDGSGHIVGLVPDIEDDSVEHTIDLGADFLEHFGVKGMRWGVRKEDVASVARTVGEAASKAAESGHKFATDVAFEVHTESGRDEHGNPTKSRATGIVARAGEKEFRSTDLPAINAKAEYVKASKLKNRLLHPLDPTTRAYRKEVRESYIKRMETTANSMKNASGTREYTIRERGGDLPRSKYGWEVSSREARHAEDGADTIFLEVLMDEDGFITGTKEAKEEDFLAQSMDLGSVLISDLMPSDEDLEHYGVKGMRWGVSRSRDARSDREVARREKRPAQDVAALPTIGLTKKSKSKVHTEGGEDHPPSDDAVKIALTKQKLKKSGVAALSNKELQELQTRLNLERNVSQLTPVGTAARGRKFVKGLTSLNKDANEFGRGALNTRSILREARA